MDPSTTIDIVVLLGVAIVLPLALGHASRWLGAAVAVAISLRLSVGPVAAGLAVVLLVIAAIDLIGRVKAAPSRSPTLDDVVTVVVGAFAVVAAAALLCSRAGWAVLGTREPIVELTAVHFTYAGVGASTLAAAARRRAIGRSRTIAQIGLLLTMAAPPVVALGFVLATPVAQVGGAVLMATGALTTATLQLIQAVRLPAPTFRRGLLAVSGLMPWIPMGLAVAWAASNYWNVPALSVDDMARTHGTMNATFVLLGLAAR